MPDSRSVLILKTERDNLQSQMNWYQNILDNLGNKTADDLKNAQTQVDSLKQEIQSIDDDIIKLGGEAKPLNG